MAHDTQLTWRNQMIYCVFVRNFSELGTFEAVQADLPRIKKMGTDIIWLLPFYPIGQQARKGSMGSPYAIQDYRKIDPAHGTESSLQQLVAACHELGMKVIIDIVYNHTSPDSWLVHNHPEWFYYKDNGQRGNKVGDWSDIVDLDYRHADLWTYQIDTLCYWATIVDGFRCDVAALVPLPFWLEAQRRVAEVNPDCLWLAESVHGHFARDMREAGHVGLSDSELYQAFDMTYDYDVQDLFDGYLAGAVSLERYIDGLAQQDYVYPANYIKLHYLENHDQPRIAQRINDAQTMKHWIAFSCFQRGAVLFYNGQERMAHHTPSLFEREVIDWQAGTDLSEWISTCVSAMKKYLPESGRYRLLADEETNTVVLTHRTDSCTIVAITTLRPQPTGVLTQHGLADGTYRNVLTGASLTIQNGIYPLGADPVLVVVPHQETAL